MSFTAKPLNDRDTEEMKKLYPLINFTVEYNPGKYLMTEEYAKVLQKIIDLEVYKDDVWVCSYLRTGTRNPNF